MCMKYLNATVSCYGSVSIHNNRILSLIEPFDVISATKDPNGTISIKNFYVVTHINMLGTNKEDCKQNSTLEKRETLSVRIRLTKCDKDENNQRYFDLDTFTVDLKEEENKRNIHKACFDYFNYKRITPVESLALPYGSGKYVIKVTVKEPSQEKETIQTMTYLYVSD